MSKMMLQPSLTIDDVINANDRETGAIIDKALADMITDTFSKYKDIKSKRSVAIELSIERVNNESIRVDAKVTPKPAPYTQRPETSKEKVAPGQVTIDEIIDAEVVEKEQPQIEGYKPLQIDHNPDSEEEDPEE